jgi:adenine-specific DNA-methyltransferase
MRKTRFVARSDSLRPQTTEDAGGTPADQRSADVPRKPKAPAKSTPISSVKHKDKRTNIPTQELRDFVRDEEAAPKTILYPRDPSLDPQLVWKGKDAQDRQDLAVPAVPIYIQEKIQPQVIIEDLRARAKKDSPDAALELFSDFNGIAFEDLVDFYHHVQNWTNRMILGDSLLVMTSLAEKEGLKGKVQTIYFDPPYGIKFGSNWQVSTRKRDVKDGKAEDVTRQPEQIRAFRDTWRFGIHSYLGYLRDRLTIAHELLTDSGSLFVQIGDENLHLVRNVLDEVFGSENFVSLISYSTTSGFPALTLSRAGDYILWYAKSLREIKYRQLYLPKEAGDSGADEYRWLLMPDGTTRAMAADELMGREAIPDGARRWRYGPLTSSGYSAEGSRPFPYGGRYYSPGPNNHWKVSPSGPNGLERLAAAGLLIARGNSLSYYLYADNYPVSPINNMWTDTKWGFDAGDKRFVVQTNPGVVRRCLLMTTDPGDLVLDPTCGSGTTAYVAEEWGRRWITIDTSRVALALARTRLMAGRYPYYLLSDSAEGARKEAELTGRVPPEHGRQSDIRKGFVYSRVPHVTLSSIANNPDIRGGLSREEIDRAIVRHADLELLYDKPFEDPRRLRVSGPFTVESLSPHRVVASEDNGPATESAGHRDDSASQFAAMVLDNLKRAGVQNTVKGERLQLDQLEPVAGQWVQAVGTYTEKSGASRRAAVSIGPEHGTVDRDLIKEAAKEAMQGSGVDLLLVCGFAFGPEASETAGEYAKHATGRSSKEPMVADSARQFGRLQVLLTRMNPDLQNDELLKKTGAANLFMVFGEPDISIDREKDGRVVISIRGLDVYDPTTGEIRSHSTDEIACWFIDTDYNGESFFVRQAYFTGADEPYEKLKRALRAEIDEAAWSALYSTKSQPFEPPTSGRIAIKVINHYGDEVLKVLSVASA